MPRMDFAIYAVHVAFWGTLGLTRLTLRSHHGGEAASPHSAPEASGEHTAPFSRTVLAFHMFAFGTMYFGIANAVLPGRVPTWFPGQRLVGSIVIMAGAGLMAWALIFFRSWRFRAKLDPGHQLATGGPFRYLRHPIYLGLNLLALGTAIWIPTALVWTGFGLMIVGSDLRARAEEALLGQSFGLAYSEYCSRTRRFIPGVY